jgi:hypothetical protein
VIGYDIGIVVGINRVKVAGIQHKIGIIQAFDRS